MADLSYRRESFNVARQIDWGAIWAGVFIFTAIWSVFGLLGMALFSGTLNSAANTTNGASVGMAIWAIVLSIIAMYVAGRQTGRLAGVSNRHDGMIHGLIMFGLSVAAMLVLAALGGYTSGAAVAANTNNSYLLHMSAPLGWTWFLSLFLGWLAAMGGASTTAGPRQRLETASNVHDMHPAA
jgi:hypothetical protein